MQQLIDLAPYWMPVALFIVTSLFNYYTVHFDSHESRGLQKVLRMLIEYASGLASKNAPGHFKLPLTSKPPVEGHDEPA